MAKSKIELPPGELWPKTASGAQVQIDVFGATGDYASGKTVLGGSIAPGPHPAGHEFAGKPRTLYLDFEKSGCTYGGMGWRRIDVAQQMQDRFQDPKTGIVKNYTPLDVFEWFAGSSRAGAMPGIIDKLRPGEYDVLICDPITDIESGLVDYVRTNPEQFHLTADQIRRAGGLLWGAVKDHWKTVLLKLSSRVKCFYFTSHLRSVWQGNQPTGKKEPKGKDTLMELASLYLWLERAADRDGSVPAIPSATVLKQRLTDTVFRDGEIHFVPLMPPRIPQATVQAIREYIANPPDYSKLKDGERVVEEKMSDDERLRLELAKAEAEAEAGATQLQLLTRRAQLAAQMRASQAAAPQAPDQTAQRQAEKQQRTQEEVAAQKKQAESDAEMEKLRAQQAEIKAKAAAETQKLMVDNDGENKLPPPPKEAEKVAETPVEQPAETTAAETAEPASRLAPLELVQDIANLYKKLAMTKDQLRGVLTAMGYSSVPDMKKADALALKQQMEAWARIDELFGQLNVAAAGRVSVYQKAKRADGQPATAVWEMSPQHCTALLMKLEAKVREKAIAGKVPAAEDGTAGN